MPVGVLVDAIAVAAGGLFGVFVQKHLSMDAKEKLNLIFGVCAMGMGIGSIVLMKHMPAVIFSVVIGTAAGLALHLGERVRKGAGMLQDISSRVLPDRAGSVSQDELEAMLVTVIVLFCASGTGVYGSIVAGMTGDHGILIAKAILDFFTAMIFSCTLGSVVSLIAIPQLMIFLALFFCARLIYPLTTPDMIDDFKAAGGFVMLATAFCMMKVKMFPTADMVPAMILVFPVSWFWSSCIVPLVS